MSLEQVQSSVTKIIRSTLDKDGYVINISKQDNRWRALVEVVEEKGYIDDVIGIYEVTLDESLNLVSYERRGLRRRSDLSPKEWEKKLEMSI